MNFLPILLIALSGLVLTAGDMAMKKWVGSQSRYWYVIGLVVYLVGLNFLAQSFKYKNIAVASVMVVIFNVVTLSLVSWFYFKERLSLLEIAGIFLGLLVVVVMELAKK